MASERPTMAYLGNSVEYALHSLLWLAAPLKQRPSARDLAALQGISPAFLSKIFQKLERVGIVEAIGGIRGGYRLAKPADDISVLEIIDAVEGRKSLFDTVRRSEAAVYCSRANRPPGPQAESAASMP
jgi:Rrf2 family protein